MQHLHPALSLNDSDIKRYNHTPLVVLKNSTTTSFQISVRNKQLKFTSSAGADAIVTLHPEQTFAITSLHPMELERGSYFSGIYIRPFESSDYEDDEIPFAVVADMTKGEAGLDIMYCGSFPHSNISLLHERTNCLHGFSPFQVVMTYLISLCPLMKSERAQVLSRTVFQWKTQCATWREISHTSSSTSSSSSSNSSESE